MSSIFKWPRCWQQRRSPAQKHSNYRSRGRFKRLKPSNRWSFPSCSILPSARERPHTWTICLGIGRGDKHSDPEQPTATGTGVLTAANGDSIFTEFTAVGIPTENPDVSFITEVHTITGGTGRFAGATGTFTREALSNLALFFSSGSLEGTISLQHNQGIEIVTIEHGSERPLRKAERRRPRCFSGSKEGQHSESRDQLQEWDWRCSHLRSTAGRAKWAPLALRFRRARTAM